jgi:hypothetical protein
MLNRNLTLKQLNVREVFQLDKEARQTFLNHMDVPPEKISQGDYFLTLQQLERIRSE